MALDLTPEQKALGQANFQSTTEGLTRRGFLKSMALGTAGVVVPVSAAVYFGYNAKKVEGKPVRTAIIGSGDEGGVLIGEHNPNFLEIVAVCDIRPTQQKRIFTGDLDDDGKPKKNIRKGLNWHYGRNCHKTIDVYTDYKEVLARKDIEAVIIALPLFLHAPVAIAAMKAKKHVLCEKLMAWNIDQCKQMARVAAEEDVILSVGHQRHYSMLYAHALEVMKAGVLGDVRHIRALWHRNNALPYPPELKKKRQPKWAAEVPQPVLKDSWYKPVLKEDYEALKVKVTSYGFKSVPELIRWRLYAETGGGLMAELGSHQLDAASIFLGKVHPIAVSGVGGKYFYTDDRDVDDHVYVTFEFPLISRTTDEGTPRKAPPDEKVIVTYSSINTNSFEGYGECVMGSEGTMVVAGEQQAMLYAERGSKSKALEVSVGSSGKGPVLDTSGSTGPALQAAAGSSSGGPVSRGYREEMEHFAFCIRMRDEAMSKDRPQVRCGPKQALADAVMALAANAAMARGERIVFEEEWFEPESEVLPKWDKKAPKDRQV